MPTMSPENLVDVDRDAVFAKLTQLSVLACHYIHLQRQ